MFFLYPVLHSGEYYLFESDSEDEEELQSEEQKPQKHTACQVRHTTVSQNVSTVLLYMYNIYASIHPFSTTYLMSEAVVGAGSVR